MTSTYLIYSSRRYLGNEKEEEEPRGGIAIDIIYPHRIYQITITFLNQEELQNPNQEIYYHAEIEYSGSSGRQSIKTVLKVDTNYNYEIHPGIVISNISGYSCRHEKIHLSEEDHAKLKHAIKIFLLKHKEGKIT